jgi:hypothetical protein
MLRSERKQLIRSLTNRNQQHPSVAVQFLCTRIARWTNSNIEVMKFIVKLVNGLVFFLFSSKEKNNLESSHMTNLFLRRWTGELGTT